jgi:TRAP-type C4-dicarboxylate transport system substrate-binding protein
MVAIGRWGVGIAIVGLGLVPSCTLGHGSAADKAGGPSSPVELRLASSDGSDQPSAAAVRYFASRVSQLSHGTLLISVSWKAAGTADPDSESRVAGMVESGRFDLGDIGARAWDMRGVESFGALQAPFLVTSTPLLDRITSGPLGRQMLDGLAPRGVVGLALVPDHPRHPIGFRRPLLSIGDFAGARIRDVPSAATDALLEALGATPEHVSSDAIGTAIDRREVDGEEVSLAIAPGGAYATVNLTFFAKASTLFANAKTMQTLTADQRHLLEQAAQDAADHVAATQPTENQLIDRYCDAGHVVVATPADVAEIERSARSVYAQLEQDALTRSMIDSIRRLKRSTVAPTMVIPPGCRHGIGANTGSEQPPALLNGTYRWQYSGQTGVSTATLRDGRWLFAGSDHDTGTYRIIGRRLIFDWPRVASVLTFTFVRDADGSIHLTPVLPMDPGDQQVWASAPWRRIGPPVAPIP